MTDVEIKRNAEVVDLLTQITGNFKTIHDLLERKTLVTDIKEACKSWLLQPFYENEHCSAGIIYIAKKDIGPCEEHIHPKSIEYLIVTNGRLMVNVMGQNIRVVEAGECFHVPANVPHYSTPMDDETEAIYVTVPRDHYIPSMIKIVADMHKAKEESHE